MDFRKLRDTLRQAPVLTLFAIVIFVGLIAYAVLQGSGDSASPTASNLPLGTALGPSVIFVSPLDSASVANPVDVKMAIGGLRFQKSSEPPQPGFGHLGLIIDGTTPAPGDIFTTDATHLDLTDASHEVILPTLSPGPHTLTAVFMDSNSVISAPLASQTISVTVTVPLTS